MGNGRLWKSVLAAALVVLFAGTLVVALSAYGVPSARAQEAGTGTPDLTGTPGGGLRTLGTGTPEAVSTAEVTGTVAPLATPTEEVILTEPFTSATALTGTVPLTGSLGTITVIGEGQANVTPDMARTNIGVEVVTDTVRAATTQARDTMNAVLTAIKAQGVADKDIQTSGFNIFMERVQNPAASGVGQEIIRYHVSNNVQVTVRQLDTVGNVLDAAIEAGANNIYGVNFTLAETKQPETEAYRLAMADARTRAQYLASLAGLQVGRVLSISEVVTSQSIISLREAASAQGMGGGGGPISPGELQVTRQIQVVFELR